MRLTPAERVEIAGYLERLELSIEEILEAIERECPGIRAEVEADAQTAPAWVRSPGLAG